MEDIKIQFPKGAEGEPAYESLSNIEYILKSASLNEVIIQALIDKIKAQDAIIRRINKLTSQQ